MQLVVILFKLNFQNMEYRTILTTCSLTKSDCILSLKDVQTNKQWAKQPGRRREDLEGLVTRPVRSGGLGAIAYPFLADT